MMARNNKPDKEWRSCDWITNDERASDELLDKSAHILAETFGGLHNVPGRLKHFGYWIELCVLGELSTFDFDRLTSLVMGAHAHCCRVSVRAASPQYLRLMFHNRQREGSMSERHPTLDEAITWRRDRRP